MAVPKEAKTQYTQLQQEIEAGTTALFEVYDRNDGHPRFVVCAVRLADPDGHKTALIPLAELLIEFRPEEWNTGPGTQLVQLHEV